MLFGEVRQVAIGSLALGLPAALALAALVVARLFWWRLGLVRTPGVAALAGLALRMATGGG